MISNSFFSLWNNFKEKSKNPFLGTYIIVWIIRNWELIYALFNFDDTYKLPDKVQFIKTYYENVHFIGNIFSNILYTIGVLILTYLLLNLSRFIVNISEKKVTPWVYKKTDKNSIVLKEDYDSLKEQRDELQKALDKERESKIRLETTISNLQERLNSFSTKEKENNNKTIGEKSSEEEVNKIIEKLEKQNLIKDFERAVIAIKKGQAIGFESVDTFIKYELIVFKNKEESIHGTLRYYNTTNKGMEVFNKIIN